MVVQDRTAVKFVCPVKLMSSKLIFCIWDPSWNIRSPDSDQERMKSPMSKMNEIHPKVQALARSTSLRTHTHIETYRQAAFQNQLFVFRGIENM